MLRVAWLLLAARWSVAAGPTEVPALPPVVVASPVPGEASVAPIAAPQAPAADPAALPAAEGSAAATPVSADAAVPPAVARRVEEARVAWRDYSPGDVVAPIAAPAPPAEPAAEAALQPPPSEPPLISRRGAAGLTLMVVSHAHYIAIPWILHLTIPLWGRVAASATAYAVSWALFGAGAYLGGKALWLRLKRRWTARTPR